jgi:hypothetical protein
VELALRVAVRLSIEYRGGACCCLEWPDYCLISKGLSVAQMQDEMPENACAILETGAQQAPRETRNTQTITCGKATL